MCGDGAAVALLCGGAGSGATRSIRCLLEVVCSFGRKPLLLPEPAMVTPAGAAYLLEGIAVMVTSPSRLLGKPMFLVRPGRPMAVLFTSHSFLKASAWWIVW